MTDKPRMKAYYYSFYSTTVPVVDKVLSAVACAGKAFHHTSDWYEECDWPDHAGTTPVDWIQNAANKAAHEIELLRAERTELRQLLVGLGAGIPAAAILRAEDRQ